MGNPSRQGGWRFKVRLKPARGLVNPGGFDYQRWLLSQGIGAQGYIKVVRLLERRPALIVANNIKLFHSRSRALKKYQIVRFLLQGRLGAFLWGLRIGDR